jgi:hypothetical protein
MRLIFAPSIAALVCHLGLAQPAAPTLRPSARVFNVVVQSRGTRQPLQGVDVTVFPVGAVGIRSAAGKTDANGRCSLTVPLDGRITEYSVQTVPATSDNLNDYVRDDYLGALASSRLVEFQGDSTALDVTLYMERPATLRGVLRDADHKPLAGVTVAALSRGRPVGLKGRWSPVGKTSVTNAAGEFTLSALNPGKYLVKATPPMQRPAGLVPTYYPGQAALESAQSIEVGDGEVRDGVDFAVSQGRLLRLTGRVRLPGGAEAKQRATVYISSLAGLDSDDRAVPVDDAGRFQVEGLPEGQYQAAAALRLPGEGGKRGRLLAGRTDFVLSAKDEAPREVALDLQAGIRIEGRFVDAGQMDTKWNFSEKPPMVHLTSATGARASWNYARPLSRQGVQRTADVRPAGPRADAGADERCGSRGAEGGRVARTAIERQRTVARV